MSETGGWCVLGVLWFGGPAGALMAAVQCWGDQRIVVWVAVAAIVAQLTGHTAGALLVRDRLPGPEGVWFAVGVLGGIVGLGLGAYALAT